MRRRRRKMSSHPASRRRIPIGEARPPSRMMAANPLRLAALLMLHLFIMPQLVNFTESSTLSRSVASDEAPSGPGEVASRGGFDDDHDDGRLSISGHAIGQSWLKANQSSGKTTSGQSNSTTQITRQISMAQLAISKQLEPSETTNSHQNNHQHQPDDLLALESSQQSANTTLGHLMQRYSSEAPYETRLNLSSNPNGTHLERPSNKTAQLLSIQTVPSLTPIYLKHPLPATLRTPQLVAFPHPASTRGQLDSGGKPVEGAERQQTFALLPSWPNIYITQREQTVSPTAATGSNRTAPSARPDPRVPMNYPNWSKSRQETQDERNRLINSEVEYDDHPKARPSTSIDDDVERESNQTITGQRPFWTSDEANRDDHEDDNSDDMQPYRNRSRQLLADSWTKLLEQAAKNNAMESLMLTNRSIVSLLCDKSDMLIKFKFKRPFHGLIETNLDPERRCGLSGNGSQYYELRIDLYDCGTRREMSRLFINNIQIRFQTLANPTKLSLSQQETDASLTWAGDQPDESSEFKTLICSYPSQSLRSPMRPQTGPTKLNGRNEAELDNGQLRWRDRNPLAGVKTSGAAAVEQNLEISQQSAPTKGGPFERIVEDRDNRASESDRLNSYGPILMALGLFLLALTVFLLCLITSVYVGRSKKQQSAEPAGRLTTVPKNGNDNSLGRLYDLAPAQMANQGGDLVRPVAPPLIGLKPTETRSSENPQGARKGPNETGSKQQQQQRQIAANPNQLKNKQKKMMVATRRGDTSRLKPNTNPNLGQRNSDASIRQKLAPNRHPRTRDDSSDQSPTHEVTSSSEISVTTIEIPYVKMSDQPQESTAVVAPTSANQLIRNASSQAPNRPKPKKVDAELQTDKPQTPPPPVETVHEEIKTTSHERIVERTSHLVEEQQQLVDDKPTGKKRQLGKEYQPARRPSPIPFGSFRAKLTSPSEYKRLNNIVQLFDFEDGQTKPEPNGAASSDLFDRYRIRLLKVMSPSERAELRRLLNENEAFRSNVVDSIDAETFDRKLKNDRRFQLQTLSKEAWDLFKEILLDTNMTKARTTTNEPKVGLAEQNAASPSKGFRLVPIERLSTSTNSMTERTVKSEREFSKVRIDSMERKRDSAPVVEKSEPKIKSQLKLDRTKSKVVERPAAEPTTVASPTCDSGTSRQFQVSQSNSTHCDGNTTFNFDTVTSISSPTHFSAFTRSTFDLKQVTEFTEDYPFPYMDE